MAEREIRFKYKFPENYNPLYANGMYGGVSPQGEIVVNFFLERIPVPHEVVHALSDKNELKEQIRQDPEDLRFQIIRFVQTGIIMSLDTAKKMQTWLDGHIKTLESVKEKQKHG